jgi:type II secretory pathway component PulJ
MNHKKRRGRPLTLLEVMVALTLTTILLSALFGTYRHLASAGSSLHVSKGHFFQRQLVDLRLRALFSEIQNSSSLYTTSHLQSKGDALVFQFDNGVDPHPDFCHLVKGMLYLDSKKNELSLLTWPSSEKETSLLNPSSARKEVLCSAATSFTFQFFDSKEEEWCGSWKKEKKELPSMIKLEIGDDLSAKEEFVYFLSLSPIVYKS